LSFVILRKHPAVILRSVATKDPCPDGGALLGAQGSFASLRMTRGR
jgi:hypothetical protein